MNTNRDLLRMRHFLHSLPQKDGKRFAPKEHKNGVDALAAAVLVGGLVQALLLALKENQRVMRETAVVLVDWLKGEHAQCELPPAPKDLVALDLQLYVARLIELNDVRRAMGVQAEALRYLSQAKLVAGAFKEASKEKEAE